MDDLREKVIRGLECCLNGPMQCIKCPYISEVGKTVPNCVKTMRTDAISLLKAQEPRVMTLEEVLAWIDSSPMRRDPIFEDSKGKLGEWIDPFDDYDTADIVGYGSNVRCWTSRPTKEQRKKVKWQ